MRLGAALLLYFAVFSTPAPARAAGCHLARRACLTAAGEALAACRSRCRLSSELTCRSSCDGAHAAASAACRAAQVPCSALCGASVAANQCRSAVRTCRAGARRMARVCRQACRMLADASQPGCFERCHQARAGSEAGCGYLGVRAVAGPATLPNLASGRAADLSLLDAEERAEIDAADARASGLRARRVRLWVGAPGVPVHVEQIAHAFPFGFPIDLRRFANADDRDWYAQTMAAHFGLVVIENSLKWAGIEPAEGARVYDDADADVSWAEGLGLPIKGHPLLWGIVPPFSSSGVPSWALSRFAATNLPPAEANALREIVRRHVLDLGGRYRGRLALWDATNETLQPFAQWFVQRLGPAIVADVFRWAREADPDALLVFNEWIVEVFTGPSTPTAAAVRDRVRALRAQGVPIDAVGQQAHFVPAAAFAGLPVDLSQRARLDDYARALDTLSEAGLPIHITETNFIAPAAPEQRAAQAEGLLRLWWGHPAVTQVVFWGPWNKVAGRDEFDVGIWDDDRNLTRHGEAVLSLLNDRWRTRVDGVTDAGGAIEVMATHGEYVAAWTVSGAPVHARFRVDPGAGTARVVVSGP